MLAVSIDHSTECATVYDHGWDKNMPNHGKPVATAIRKRRNEQGPAWKVYATDGSLIASIWVADPILATRAVLRRTSQWLGKKHD